MVAPDVSVLISKVGAASSSIRDGCTGPPISVHYPVRLVIAAHSLGPSSTIVGARTPTPIPVTTSDQYCNGIGINPIARMTIPTQIFHQRCNTHRSFAQRPVV